MTIPASLIQQFKTVLQNLVNSAFPQKLAQWFGRLLTTIENDAGQVDPRLLASAGANPDIAAGDAPEAVKETILNLLRVGIAKIPQPLVRLALYAAVNALGAKLIDQAYDAIFGTNTATTDLVGAGANLTELGDLHAVDHLLPECK